MKLNRRVFSAGALALPFAHIAAANAQTPEASPAAGGAMIPAQTIDGANPFSLSPNGATVAAVAMDMSFVFLDAETLEVIAETAPPEPGMEPRAEVSPWSPDSTMFAVGTMPAQSAMQTPVQIVDVQSGEVIVTSAGTAASATPVADASASATPVGSGSGGDSNPTWTSATTVAFVRMIDPLEAPNADWATSICSLDIESGEVTTLVQYPADELLTIPSVLHGLDDGRIVHGASQPAGYYVVETDGTYTFHQVKSAGVQAPLLLDADESAVLLVNVDSDKPDVIQVALEDPKNVKRVRELFGLAEDAWYYSPPLLGPSTGSMVVVAGDEPEVLLLESGNVRSLGVLDDAPDEMYATWEGSRVLIDGGPSFWLVDAGA